MKSVEQSILNVIKNTALKAIVVSELLAGYVKKRMSILDSFLLTEGDEKRAARHEPPKRNSFKVFLFYGP